MTLINSPTCSPRQTVKILENFSDGELAEHETFYHNDEYQARFWHHSRLLSLLVATSREYKIYRSDNFSDGEVYLLSQAIIEAFATAVHDNGSKFMILHLPPGNHFEDYANTGEF